MRKVQLPILVSGIATKVDGSIKITLETREFKPAEATKLFGLRNQEAWIMIAPNAMTEKDVKLPREKADPAVGVKTPSQRLRAVIYRLWEQSGTGADFESYYRIKMDNIIEQLKERLE